MDPPLNRLLKPVVATPYSPNGEPPSWLVQDPVKLVAVLEAEPLVQRALPGDRVVLVSASVGDPKSMSKVTPVKALPWAAVPRAVVLVRTSVKVLPEMV